MPEMLKMRGSKVLIVDEAHILDDVMSDFISIKITENIIKRLKFSDEKGIISDLKKVKQFQIMFLSRRT
jgi:Rad3-related DNA helicase